MIGYYENIKIRLGNINVDEILKQSLELLDCECEELESLEINLDEDIRAFGAHEKGKIMINCNFISNNISNILYKVNCEKLDDFIDYFIESIIVHEIHHAYMYYCRKEEYLNYKADEEYKLYCDRPLELKADNFMEQYMVKYNGNDGEQIAKLSKIMRSYPGGENKQSLIDDIIKTFR